jgi:hypothetical protein
LELPLPTQPRRHAVDWIIPEANTQRSLVPAASRPIESSENRSAEPESSHSPRKRISRLHSILCIRLVGLPYLNVPPTGSSPITAFAFTVVILAIMVGGNLLVMPNSNVLMMPHMETDTGC